MTLPLLAFYMFSSFLLFAASMVVFARNPVHSVLFLILAFFNAACLLLLLGAEFLGMILLIVYIGAVAVLFLFVVMMLQTSSAAAPTASLADYAPAGFFVAGVLLLELLFLFLFPAGIDAPALAVQGASAVPVPEGISNSAALGAVLYTRFVHFFQIAGMVLLSAMVAAITLTLRTRPGIKRQDPGAQARRTREESVELRKVEPGQGVSL